jgi:3-oxosteroid 1-dehydrogenase
VEEAAWDESWSKVVDVIVVGSGAAGFAAAIAAANQGRSVVMVEKSEHLGGTTAHSSGTMWVPNNPLMAARGLEDPRPEALRFLAKHAYPADYRADAPDLGLGTRRYGLIEGLYDNGAKALELLQGLGALPIDEEQYPTLPDYYTEDPDNVAPVGRSIRIQTPPGYRPGVGTTGGQIMLAQMEQVARSLGVEIRSPWRVTEAVQDDSGTVVGVIGEGIAGAEMIGARAGVVFASGGFAHNPELTAAYLRGPVLGGCGSPSATGDFVGIATRTGAMLGNMGHAWWDQVVVEAAARSRATSRDCIYPFGDSMMIVDSRGKRVMNEKRTYSERGQVHHYWDPDRLEYSNLLLYMIFDDAVLHDQRFSRHRYPVPDENGGHENLISASSVNDLSVAIAARLEQLSGTIGEHTLAGDFADALAGSIARFGHLAIDGVDVDHGRGESAIERAWATEPRSGAQKNPTMHPFSTEGQVHCVILGPGLLDTKGGPVVDARGRVLDHSERPIPGLYGAGNCVASPTGQAYYGPGGTIGPAITLGVAAGLDAAARKDHVPVFSF